MTRAQFVLTFLSPVLLAAGYEDIIQKDALTEESFKRGLELLGTGKYWENPYAAFAQ